MYSNRYLDVSHAIANSVQELFALIYLVPIFSTKTV